MRRSTNRKPSNKQDNFPVNVRVSVFNANDAIEREKVINIRDKGDKDWLWSSIVWASHNNCEIEIDKPSKDA